MYNIGQDDNITIMYVCIYIYYICIIDDLMVFSQIYIVIVKSTINVMDLEPKPPFS